MKHYVKGIAGGLAVAVLLVGVFELAGGDATVIVLLVLLAAHVKIRLDELRDTLEVMQAPGAEEECGESARDPLSGERYVCTLAHGHRDPWHSDGTPVRWRDQPGPTRGGQ